MTVTLLIIGSVLLLIVLIGFFYYALKRNLGTRGISGAGDPVNLLSLAVNIVVTILSVMAVVISLITYLDAKRSGDRQLETLKQSRDALGKVSDNVSLQVNALRQQTQALTSVQQAFQSEAKLIPEQVAQAKAAAESIRSAASQMKEQRELLGKVRTTLDQQLEIAQAENQRELERLKRKPKAEFTLGSLPEESFPKSYFTIGPPPYNAIIGVINKGDAGLISPVLLISVFPESVTIRQRMMGDNFGSRKNILQFSGPTVATIEPVNIAAGPYIFEVAFDIPDKVDSFFLNLRVYGSNMESHTAVASIHVDRAASNPSK